MRGEDREQTAGVCAHDRPRARTFAIRVVGRQPPGSAAVKRGGERPHPETYPSPSDAPMFKRVRLLFPVKLLPELPGTLAKGARWRE